MHFNGQSTTRVDGARASGVTYCLVHELRTDGTAIRYLDSFVKRDSRSFIRQRQVVVDWTETRALAGAVPVT
jgi:hypothetical protein